MKQIFIFIICIITAGSVSFAGNTSALKNTDDSVKIRKILKQIAKENVFEEDGNTTEVQQQNFRLLKSSGSTFDFLKIAMNDKNPVVRLYAFKAASERMDELPVDLVLKFKKDSSIVKVRSHNKTTEVPVYIVANSFLK